MATANNDKMNGFPTKRVEEKKWTFGVGGTLNERQPTMDKHMAHL